MWFQRRKKFGLFERELTLALCNPASVWNIVLPKSSPLGIFRQHYEKRRIGGDLPALIIITSPYPPDMAEPIGREGAPHRRATEGREQSELGGLHYEAIIN